MDDQAQIAAFVYAPEGVRDEPGTPFGVAGDKHPVLMLHGNGEEHGIFGPLIDAACEAGHSVIALDSRAQGRSTRGNAPLSYELMAADALECMSRLGVSQAHVVGFSDGAIEALLLGRDHPLRVLSLLAMGANLTPEGVVELDGWDMSADLRRLTKWATWAQGLPREGVIDPELLSPTPDEAMQAAELLRLMRDEPRIAAESLSSIACPTCIVAGEFDCIREEETRAIYEGIRAGGNTSVRLVIVPGVEHNLPKQAPELVSSLMLDTIATARGQRRAGPRACQGVSVCHLDPSRTDLIEPLERLYLRASSVSEDGSGWRPHFWPPDGLVRSYALGGTTWMAFDARSLDGQGAPLMGACPLGAVSLDENARLESKTEPDWQPLRGREALGVHLLAVDPDARGRGVATALLEAVEKEAARRGAKALRLNTSPENSAANCLYRRHGFIQHHSVRLPYEGLPISAWTNVWEKPL